MREEVYVSFKNLVALGVLEVVDQDVGVADENHLLFFPTLKFK
jgi:hypothetical protein